MLTSLLPWRASAVQATTESARQLSVAHAHAGAISLMTGDLAEAEGRFECQLEEAQKVTPNPSSATGGPATTLPDFRLHI